MSDLHRSSVFWVNVMIGCLLFAVSLAIAPLLAAFYQQEELTSVIRLSSVGFLIASFGVAQQAMLMKEMSFKALMIRDISATLLAGATGIVMALLGFGVWSLVGQMLAFTIIDTLALWIFSTWRPSWCFSWATVRDLAGFSGNLLAFGIVNYLARNTDYLLIGKFLGAEALGLYTLAYKLMLVPLQNVSWVISKVMFPAFSRVQDRIDKIRNAYLKIIKLVSLIAFPMMAGLFALAPALITTAFGDRWRSAVLPIQILALCGMLQSVGTMPGTVFRSQGRADIELKLGILNALLTALGIAYSLRWGIVGVATAYTLVSVIWVHLAMLIAARLLRMSFFDCYVRLLPAYALSLLLILALWFLQSLIRGQSFLTIGFITCTGLVIYGGLLIAMGQVIFKDRKPLLQL